MKKKIILLLLAVLALGIISAEAAYPDTSDSPYSDAIDFVSAVGIFKGNDNGEFLPDNEISRAEMTAVVMRILQMENVGGDALFSDVADSHWASGSINGAAQMKIVSGFGDGTFRPEDKVSCEQAIKMLLCAANYGVIAEKQGGYPYGYIKTAANNNMLDGISVNYGSPATRGIIAQLVYNAINMDIVEEKITADGVTYEIIKDKSLISKMFDVEKKKGRVTGTYLTFVSNRSAKLNENQIMIDDEIYLCEAENSDELLGYYVDYYLRDDGGEETVVIAAPKAKTEKTSVRALDITDISADSEGNITVNYRQNQRNRSLGISKSSPWVYNGKILSDGEKNSTVADIGSGELILLDNGTDAENVFFIRDAENILLEGKNTSSSKVTLYDRYKNNISYDKDDRDVHIKIARNGEKAELSQLQTNDALTAYISRDGKAVEIVASDRKAKGRVTALSDDADRKFADINGTSYPIADSFLGQTKYTIALNNSGVFFLNCFDEIVGTEKNSDDDAFYGYLIRYEIKGIGNKVKFQVLNDSNKLITYETENKIKFISDSGKETLSASVAAERFRHEPNAANINTVDRQLIRYKLSGDGKISEIALAKSTPSSEEFSLFSTFAPRVYNSSEFDEKYRVNSDTKVFYIPGYGEDCDVNTSGNPYKYFVTGKTYTVALYDVDDSKTAAAVEIKTSVPDHIFKTKISLANSNVIVVDKTANTAEADNDTVVYGYQNGEYVSVILSSELSESGAAAKDFIKGSVIQYETNYQEVERASDDDVEERVILYKVLYRKDMTEEQRLYDGCNVIMPNCALGTSLGTVEYADDTNISVSFGGENETTFSIDGSIDVYRFNNSDKELYKASVRDISKGQRVFIRQRYQRVMEVLIVE